MFWTKKHKDYHFMNDYGEVIITFLLSAKHEQLSVNFLWVTFQVLVSSYVSVCIVLIIFGHLSIVVSVTTLVFGNRFSNKKSLQETNYSFCIKGQIAADSQKSCKKFFSHAEWFMNHLFLCKSKECFRCDVSFVWCWIIYVILSANKIARKWAPNQLDPWTEILIAKTDSSSIFSLFVKLVAKKINFQGRHPINI